MSLKQGLPREARLRRRGDFLRVQGRGCKHHLRHFLVFVAPAPRDESTQGSGLPLPRLGVTVTRKVGNAVVRNQIRRWVREAYRRRTERFTPGLEMVWVAKRNRLPQCFDDVEHDMLDLLHRLPGSGAQP